MQYYNAARKRGSDRNGRSFDAATIRAVWNKAAHAPGFDPAYVRLDSCGAWIEWAKYGDTTPGGNGWEVDHIKPVAAGGGDELSNLQALQWENNRHKGDQWPYWSCYYGSKAA